MIFMRAQLHEYVVRETALSWQKSVFAKRPVGSECHRREMGATTDAARLSCRLVPAIGMYHRHVPSAPKRIRTRHS